MAFVAHEDTKPSNGILEVQYWERDVPTMTPEIVDEGIRAALKAGWNPKTKGTHRVGPPSYNGMNIRRLANKAVVVQVRYMSIDEMEFRVPNDFEGMIDALCDADGFTNAVRIDDKKLRDIFEKAGLIRTNVRGSSYATDKLKKYRDALEEAYIQDMPEAAPCPSRASSAS
jgi:hypothetical protein